MTTAEIDRAIALHVVWLKYIAPHDTYNLMNNGIKFIRTGVNEWRVYVDLDVAPYMPYTNEPWLSPYWRGKQNPNEKWWNDAIKEFMRRLAQSLGGELRNV